LAVLVAALVVLVVVLVAVAVLLLSPLGVGLMVVEGGWLSPSAYCCIQATCVWILQQVRGT
jgi:hypothetical protein